MHSHENKKHRSLCLSIENVQPSINKVYGVHSTSQGEAMITRSANKYESQEKF